MIPDTRTHGKEEIEEEEEENPQSAQAGESFHGMSYVLRLNSLKAEDSAWNNGDEAIRRSSRFCHARRRGIRHM